MENTDREDVLKYEDLAEGYKRKLEKVSSLLAVIEHRHEDILKVYLVSIGKEYEDDYKDYITGYLNQCADLLEIASDVSHVEGQSVIS